MLDEVSVFGDVFVGGDVLVLDVAAELVGLRLGDVLVLSVSGVAGNDVVKKNLNTNRTFASTVFNN